MDEVGIELARLYPYQPDNGNCFPVAYHLAVIDPGMLDVNEDEITVVHGLPIGRGLTNEGKRFWHAWVEVKRTIWIPEETIQAYPEFALLNPIVLETVIDRSSGKNLSIPRSAYYSMGQLSDEFVWRFTPEEAAAEMESIGHYGPWVEGWQEMEDI